MVRSFAKAAAATLVLLVAPATAAELVYVFDPGCPYCRLWDREIGPAYGRTAEGKRASLVALDRRDPALASLKLAAPVRYTPTFILVEDGVEVGRIVGYQGEDFFWGQLAGLLERLREADRKRVTD
ncbi:MAG TPA: thioredoxin family protein [Alphaproteobacteria bacterium]|nr:thioredoxin family protein [Alphaproteobacteria bacterium]